MRIRWVLLALSLCLAGLPSGRVSAAASLVNNWKPGAPDTTAIWHGFEIGPTFSMPIPAGSASPDELGMDVGLSFTTMGNPFLGIGVDVAYHYWPVSSEFKDSFNDILRPGTFNTLELGGTTWRPSALQLTGHLKLAAPPDRAWIPWLQAGAGLYHVDPNIAGYRGDAGFFTITIGPLNSTSHLGYYFSTGVDFPTWPRTRLGLVGSYHRVMCADRYGSDLGIFSVGGHLLFGR